MDPRRAPPTPPCRRPFAVGLLVTAALAPLPGAVALGVLGVLGGLGGLGGLRAQQAAPGGENATTFQQVGSEALEREDPTAAWSAFRSALALAPAAPDPSVGLGRSHLLLGRAATALCYADAVLEHAAGRQDAMALAVRARIRARRFDEAVAVAQRFVARQAEPSAELLAALASALFRVQQTDDAATVYRRVLELEPAEPEAHLRLGSGLSAPQHVVVTAALRAAVVALRNGNLDEAIDRLNGAMAEQGADPVLHRLLGEALFQRRALASMASRDEAFARLRGARPAPDAVRLPVGEFMAAYPLLDAERRAVVDRAVALFGSRLDRLVAIGARHDLLLEVERTTDAPSRQSLRGRRTFDGRVWDDVRGIGGLHAATGIEALDEAAGFGFDTLVHELAHQVHYYALPQLDRVRIRHLYVQAKAAGWCLDYYAATNEAEYFGQGVEAFASLAKRPGGETTHGHTRFELYRVDRELHDFIAGVVDVDPLRNPDHRQPLLAAAAEVALRCGRPDDAVVAAMLMESGEQRDTLLARARIAALAAREY